jgi:hypothetical protein
MPTVTSATYTVRAGTVQRKKNWSLRLSCGHTVQRFCEQQPKFTSCEFCEKRAVANERTS